MQTHARGSYCTHNQITNSIIQHNQNKTQFNNSTHAEMKFKNSYIVDRRMNQSPLLFHSLIFFFLLSNHFLLSSSNRLVSCNLIHNSSVSPGNLNFSFSNSIDFNVLAFLSSHFFHFSCFSMSIFPPLNVQPLSHPLPF